MGKKSRSRSRSNERKSRSRSRSPRSSRSKSASSRSRSRSTSPYYINGGTRVHVGDLGLDCSRRELEKAFKKFGTVAEVWLARNPPCFAFIVFKHKEDAEDAVKEMDGKTVCGGKVRVSLARPRTRGFRRRRGFDPNLRCYQCGARGHFSRDCKQFRSYRPSFRRSRSRSRSRTRSPPARRQRRSRSRDRRSNSQVKEKSSRRDSGSDQSRSREDKGISAH